MARGPLGMVLKRFSMGFEGFFGGERGVGGGGMDLALPWSPQTWKQIRNCRAHRVGEGWWGLGLQTSARPSLLPGWLPTCAPSPLGNNTESPNGPECRGLESCLPREYVKYNVIPGDAGLQTLASPV